MAAVLVTSFPAIAGADGAAQIVCQVRFVVCQIQLEERFHVPYPRPHLSYFLLDLVGTHS